MIRCSAPLMRSSCVLVTGATAGIGGSPRAALFCVLTLMYSCILLQSITTLLKCRHALPCLALPCRPPLTLTPPLPRRDEGKAIAKIYAERATSQEPVSLIITGRRENLLKDLCQDLEANKHVKAAQALAVDVSDKAAMLEAVRSLPSELSDIDVLVNNAGLALGTLPIQDGIVEDWETMVDVNCKGLLYTTKAVLPGMVQRGKGHVINVGSVAGTYSYPGGNVVSLADFKRGKIGNAACRLSQQ